MKKLDVSKDEKKSISIFLSDRQASIKMLTNFDPIDYVKLYEDGVLLYGNPENPNELANGKERFREDIDNFVNIYAAMYKDMLQRRMDDNKQSKEFVRGENNANIKDMNGKNRKILAVCENEDEAKKYCGDDAAIIRITADSDVPYLDISKEKFSSASKDDETIIAPFTKIDDIELEKANKNIVYYNAKVSKQELADVPKDDITNNRRAVTNGFERNIKNIFEYNNLENKKTAHALELYNKTIIYKGKLLTMLEGMCKEKEKELEEKYTELKNEKDLQTQKQVFDNYRRVRNQSLEIAANMYNDTYGLYALLNDDDKKFEDKAATYGLTFDEKIDLNSSNEIIKRIFNNYKHFKTDIEELNISASSNAQDILEAELYLRPKLDMLSVLYTEKTEEFKNIRHTHNRNGNKSINKNLYKKVFKIIQDEKLSKIKEDRQKLEEEKVGFFGRLFGKEKLKRERLKNFDLQIELEEKKQPEERQDYSIIDTLSDMHAYELVNNPSEKVNEILNNNGNKITKEVLTELQKSFNPDIKKIYDQIIYNEKDFDLMEISETTAQASNSYYKANLPMPVSNKKVRTKDEIEYFKQINGYLQTEIEKISNAGEGVRNITSTESTNDICIRSLKDIEKQTEKIFLKDSDDNKDIKNKDEKIIEKEDKEIEEK